VCFELEGAEQDLINGMNKMCSRETGVTFAAKMSLTGHYEGRVVLYEADKYPFGCLGPCRFMWMPSSGLVTSEASQRRIWLWVHPSIHRQVLQELVNIFNLQKEDAQEIVEKSDDSPAVKKRKFETESSAKQPSEDSRVAVFSNELKAIKLTNLKDKLMRFKLLGPLSSTILGSVLNQADFSELEKNDMK
jgi:hypothetical protein